MNWLLRVLGIKKVPFIQYGYYGTRKGEYLMWGPIALREKYYGPELRDKQKYHSKKDHSIKIHAKHNGLFTASSPIHIRMAKRLKKKINYERRHRKETR